MKQTSCGIHMSQIGFNTISLSNDVWGEIETDTLSPKVKIALGFSLAKLVALNQEYVHYISDTCKRWTSPDDTKRDCIHPKSMLTTQRSVNIASNHFQLLCLSY